MDRYGINETENNAIKMMEKSSAHLADLETEAFSYAAQGDVKRATETMYSEDYMKGEAEVGQTVNAIKEMNRRLKTIIHDMHHLLFAMADGNFQVSSSSEEMYVGE